MLNKTHLASFLTHVVNENLDDAGILADWLEEQGEATIGRLLRLRWKRFRTEYKRAKNRDEQDERRIAYPWYKTPPETEVVTTKVVWRRFEASERFRRYINRAVAVVLL